MTGHCRLRDGAAAIRVLGVLVALGLTLAGCPPQSDEILIGEYGSLTGGTATFGTSSHEGLTLALEEINAAGGLLGKRVRVITEDDQSKPEEAVTAVLKLIKQNKVVAVIGEVASSRSLAAAPVCQSHGIPMLTPSSTNPKITQVGDYIFRACFTDPFQGSTMARFAIRRLKARRLAILTDTKNDYSVGLTEFFRDTIKALGGEIVALESYSEGDIEFKAQLTALKAHNPDAIYIPGYYTECALIARQARELGLAATLLGGDGWDSPKTPEIGGRAVEGVYITTHYSPEDERPEVQRFLAQYRARYKGRMPDAMAVLGYDAMKMMADAIERAGSTDGARIRDALAATRDFPGVSGRITIDADRNAKKAIVVLRIQDGRFRFVESIEP